MTTDPWNSVKAITLKRALNKFIGILTKEQIQKEVQRENKAEKEIRLKMCRT